MKLLKSFCAGVVFIFIGGLAGYFYRDTLISRTTHEKKEVSEDRGSQIRQGGYTFINPLLECEIAGPAISNELKSFRTSLGELIKSAQDSGKIKEASVYFRDLNNGPWYGIRENERFTPASLLKLPLLIAYLKLSETDPTVLPEKITYSDTDATNAGAQAAQIIEPEERISDGEEYTVEELLRRMIIYSDNGAMYTLWGHISSINRDRVYTDFGMQAPLEDTPDNYMSVRNYASFFRILYNASYLSKEKSEWALQLLSQVKFKDGLVAGVPPELVISHKFGERSYAGTVGGQLHDCGIVYYPKHPYLLCVMTRGNEVSDETAVISDISKFVYNEVNSQLKEP